MALSETVNDLDADTLAMCVGMLQQQHPDAPSLYADEINGFPRDDAEDYAWNIVTGLNHGKFEWAGREFGRLLNAGLDIHPSLPVLMGHVASARVVFGACRTLLQARGVNEDDLWQAYTSADATHMRDFRAWFAGLPERPMTFAEFMGSLAVDPAQQSA